MDFTAHHVGIVVSDLERSRAFYGALGFETVSEVRQPDKTLTFMRLGSFEVELFCYGDTPPSPAEGRTLGFRHLALSTPDIEFAIADLAAAGFVPEDQLPRDVPGLARLVFIRDPDGLEIEITQPL